MGLDLPLGVEVRGDIKAEYEHILTKEALTFIATLHRKFNNSRLAALNDRIKQQKIIDEGGPLKFPVGNHENKWKVALIPTNLQCRHVEITGPVTRRIIIKALNSGADVFMADFEDSCSPTWQNVMDGQVNLYDANKRTIRFHHPDGSIRTLNNKIAQLFVRIRGWHCDEKHILIDGIPTGASFIDFGLYFYHNIRISLANNTSTYFYLPKMEYHSECRLWNKIFDFSEEYMGVPKGVIRATIMIETLPAAFEMEAMLYELRNYACAMNTGKWDYIFSAIKTLKSRREFILPERKQVTKQIPFMQAYGDRLVQVCHKHGAIAIGGQSSYIPSRKNPEENTIAEEQVTVDKMKELNEGYDGTWVAHPDLVHLVKKVFYNGLDGQDNQMNRLMDHKTILPKDLTATGIKGGKITEVGIRINIYTGLSYLNCWFQGRGAFSVNNRMEDAATAELSRSQLWQWLKHKVKLDDGRTFSEKMFRKLLDEEIKKSEDKENKRLLDEANILEQLVISKEFVEFLSTPAYKHLVDILGK